MEAETRDLTQAPLATHQLDDEQMERLTDTLDLYLSSLEADAPLSPETLYAQHPDLCEPLREYIQSLDDLHCAAAGLDQPIPNPCPDPHPDPRPTPINTAGSVKQLGDYLLGRELGRGGMGVVYEATQISLDRRVALKVLPFAAVLDGTHIARFRTEAQAAAQILHPNIVPVYAIGMDRGVHYYAMQLIDGQPLDRAIADLRRQARRTPGRDLSESLSRGAAVRDTVDLPEETLGGSVLSNHHPASADYFLAIARLGVQAADALHAAHEHGVVHRDVKPSNLLLDGNGKLWVADFGLARCQHTTSLSRTGDLVGTARYMSPEQAAGKPALIDQRTDVYSLGVTLYELLTLRPAVPGDDGPELLRHLDQADPKRPRKLNPAIPAALENVILKAIAKPREERYTTAADFADDLRRFVEGKPTIARPPTLLERASNWAMRRRRVVIGALCLSVLLCCGFALSTLLIAREKRRAEENFQRAERNLVEARKAVERFGSQFAERLAAIPSAAPVRHDMLRATLETYRRFAEQAADDPALQGELAMTYSKIGAVMDQMGSTQQAIQSHKRALALFDGLVRDSDRSDPMELRNHQRRLALCLNNLALTLQRAGDLTRATRRFSEAIEIQRLLAYSPDRVDRARPCLPELAVTYANRGRLLAESQDTDQQQLAAVSFQKAIELQRQLVSVRPEDPSLRKQMAATYNNLSAVYLDTDQPRAAKCYASALLHLKQALTFDNEDPELLNQLASTHGNLASLRMRQGRLAAALEGFRKAIELQQTVVQSTQYRNEYRHDLAIAYNNYGLALSQIGQHSDAERAFRETLSVYSTLTLLDSGSVAIPSSYGGAWNNLAFVLEKQRRWEEAASAYAQAIEQQEYALAKAPASSQYRGFLSKHYFNLGRVLRELRREDEAIEVALKRRDLWTANPTRLLSVAEEVASAAAWLDRPTDKLPLILDLLDEVAAAGGDVPRDLASRHGFKLLNNRLAGLTPAMESRWNRWFRQ